MMIAGTTLGRWNEVGVRTGYAEAEGRYYCDIFELCVRYVGVSIVGWRGLIR